MAIKISSLVQILFVVLFIAFGAVEARGGGGGGGRSTSGLSRRQATTLTSSLYQSDREIQNEIETQPSLSESVRLSCSQTYNESVGSLTETLIHLNHTGNPPQNETAFIVSWVKRAERNESDCLHSSATKFAAFSYVFSSLLYFTIALVVLQVFSVYY